MQSSSKLHRTGVPGWSACPAPRDRRQYLLYAGFCMVGLTAGVALLLLLGGKGGPDQTAGYTTAAPGDAVTFEEFLGNVTDNTIQYSCKLHI